MVTDKQFHVAVFKPRTCRPSISHFGVSNKGLKFCTAGFDVKNFA